MRSTVSMQASALLAKGRPVRAFRACAHPEAAQNSIFSALNQLQRSRGRGSSRLLRLRATQASPLWAVLGSISVVLLVAFSAACRYVFPQDDDELPWERKEKLQKLADSDSQDLPFGVYLLGSAIIAIAAVGSIFEIINKNSIFGVLPPSNPLWLPILGFFGLTGIPSAGFLFLKAIKSANAETDRQNKIDGF